jgi:hypothetical protein
MVATVSVLGLIVTLVFGREDTEQHVMRDFLGLPSPALAAMNESVTPLYRSPEPSKQIRRNNSIHISLDPKHFS